MEQGKRIIGRIAKESGAIQPTIEREKERERERLDFGSSSPRESQSHCDRGHALSLIKCARNQAGGCIPYEEDDSTDREFSCKKHQAERVGGREFEGGGQDKARWPEVVSLVIFAFIGQP